MICVSVCVRTIEDLIDSVQKAQLGSDLIEVRFDCLRDDQVDRALGNLPKTDKPYLITFRPGEHGGKRVLSDAERTEFWVRAASVLSGLDFLADHEPDLELPQTIPAEDQILSIHDFTRTLSDVVNNIDARAAGKGILKIAAMSADATDAIPLWKLLLQMVEDGHRIIPIAMGEAGKWTRILGPAYGGFLTFASLDPHTSTAPGQLSAGDLKNVYRANKIRKSTEVFGVIAGDTSYSMSPYIHNAAFMHATMDRVFIPIQVADLSSFISRMVFPGSREIDLNFQGFSVTNPHKQAIIEFLYELDDAAQAIGAVNTVKLSNGRLIGFNTDADGFIIPLLREFASVSAAHAVVVGAGGASRACVYALTKHGATVTVAARDLEKARIVAEKFGANAAELSPAVFREAEIVVNATPAGTKGLNANSSIASAEDLGRVKLVYDLTYDPAETILMKHAKAAGCKTLGGLEMLIEQALRQFEIWTGHAADINVMRAAAEARLNNSRREN